MAKTNKYRVAMLQLGSRFNLEREGETPKSTVNANADREICKCLLPGKRPSS